MPKKKAITLPASSNTGSPAGWKMPALATTLSKINQENGSSGPDLVDGQVVCLKRDGVFRPYKVDFVSSQTVSDEQRVDMLVLSGIANKAIETLTYWTDFETELAMPILEGTKKMFLDDFFNPEVVVFNDVPAQVISAQTPAAKHSWPPALTSQHNLVRMEATGGSNNKFWSIWNTNSKTVKYFFGCIGDPNGSEGTYGSYAVRQAGGAAAFMQKKIDEKLRKGYVKV